MKTYIKIIGLLMAIVVVVGFGVPSLVLNGAVFAKGETDASSIGGVSVEGLSQAEILPAVRTAVEQWQEQPLNLSGGGMKLAIDAKDLQFDLEQAVAQYEMLTKKPWYAFWQKDKVVHIPIPVTVNETIMAQVDEVVIWESEKTLTNLTTQAGLLRNDEIEAVVNDALTQADERIGFQVADIPAGVLGISDIVATLNDVFFVPNQPVSLLTLLGEQIDGVNEAGLDFLASMLYSTILQTDYEIIERHSQQVLPSYLQKGIEADMNVALAKDLKFANVSEQPGRLNTTIEGNTLKMEVFAPTKNKDITVRVTKDKIVKPRVVYRYAEDVKVGQERIVQEGQEGVRVEVYRSVGENGTTDEQLVSRDYYAPQNRIIIRSSKEPIAATPPTQNAGASATDPDLQIDLDGNGLPDTQSSATTSKDAEDGPDIVYGYYDKGGNFVQTSP